jgi:hypothetical protein
MLYLPAPISVEQSAARRPACGHISLMPAVIDRQCSRGALNRSTGDHDAAGGDGQQGLSLSEVTVRFGGIAALSGVSLEAAEGQVVGIIGPKGNQAVRDAYLGEPDRQRTGTEKP